MSRSSYCKKCGKDFDVTDRCPECGAKLTAAAVRTAWCTPNTPVKDWMSWNAVMRVALPAFAAGCVIVFLLELAAGGPGAFGRMLAGGFLPVAGLVLLVLTAATLAALALRGSELLDCVLDGKGVHVSVYLTDPTPMKLLLRFRSPSLLERADRSGRVSVLLLSTRELAWKDVARVQLWPQKALILFYAPAWWMRVPVQATPFDWDDALEFIREKLGRKKTVGLPGVLVAPPKPKKPAAVPKPAVPEPDPIPVPVTDLSFPDSEEAVPEDPFETETPAESTEEIPSSGTESAGALPEDPESSQLSFLDS